MVLTILKNISQWDYPIYYGKIKNSCSKPPTRKYHQCWISEMVLQITSVVLNPYNKSQHFCQSARYPAYHFSTLKSKCLSGKYMCLSSVQGAELRFPEPDRPKNPTMVLQRKPVIDEINRYTHVNIYIYNIHMSPVPGPPHPPLPPVIYFVLRVYTMLSCMLTCALNSYLSCALRMAQD